jgi:hypothetical protein
MSGGLRSLGCVPFGRLGASGISPAAAGGPAGSGTTAAARIPTITVGISPAGSDAANAARIPTITVGISPAGSDAANAAQHGEILARAGEPGKARVG